MSITLGTNILALRSIRQLNKVSQELSTIYERLSSGQRINRASDDAAGLAIADSLRAESRMLTVANRNINDGISLLNIADTTLESQSQIVIRLKELAEQAANGSYSNTQRKALNGEYQSLVDEFNRLGQTAKFNGTRILTGGGNLTFQVGTDSTGNSTITSAVEPSITGVGVVGSEGDYNGGGGVTLADIPNFTAFHSQPRTLDELYNFLGTNALSFTLTDSAGNQRNVLSFVALAGMLGPGAPGFLASFYERSDGLYSMDDEIPDIGATSDRTTNQLMTFADTGTTASLTIDYGNYTMVAVDDEGFVQTTVIEFTGVDTQSRGRDALNVLTARLDQLSSQRGIIGASQSRLEVAANLNAVRRQALLDAESRIRDADIAAEAANLISKQILQRTAAAVLAQANQQPALALQLLKSL